MNPLLRVDLRAGVAVFGCVGPVARVLGELGVVQGLLPQATQAPPDARPPQMAFVLVSAEMDLGEALRAVAGVAPRVAVIGTSGTSGSAEEAGSFGVFVVASSQADGFLGLAAPWSLPGLVGVAPEDAGAFFAPGRLASAKCWEIGSWAQPRVPELAVSRPSAVLLSVFTDVAAQGATLTGVGNWYREAVEHLEPEVDALLSVHDVPCGAPFAIVTTVGSCS